MMNITAMEIEMVESELAQKLKLDLTKYMRSKEMDKLNFIRGIFNEINLRDMRNIEIDDNEVIKVLRSKLKKRKESIEIFQKAGRSDLVEKETTEMRFIEQHLPKEQFPHLIENAATLLLCNTHVQKRHTLDKV